MPTIERSGRVKLARAYYDFAVDGGAVATLPLRGDGIPLGAIILDALIDVQTVLTSGGAATLGISSEGASDLQTAVVVSGAPWSTATGKRGTMTATSTPIKTTAARSIAAVIGAFALTAGKFTVLVRYVEA